MIPIVFHPDYLVPLRRGHPFPMSKSGYLRSALIARGLAIDPHFAPLVANKRYIAERMRHSSH